jgi:hypothetical protein
MGGLRGKSVIYSIPPIFISLLEYGRWEHFVACRILLLGVGMTCPPGKPISEILCSNQKSGSENICWYIFGIDNTYIEREGERE